jgi:ribosomal protein S18 acetylase RimI-like enzyme
MSTSEVERETAIRKATRDDVKAVAAALARAYHDDPVWSWIIPGEKNRTTRLSRYFEIEMRHMVLPYDTAWTTQGTTGGALCAPPDHWRLSPLTMIVQGPAFIHALGPNLPRSLRALALVEKKHPKEPHYFLAYIGLEPGSQGRGIGAELVRPVLDRCDSEGMPAYLEATSERAVRFYERHGFKVTEEVQLGKGPSMWLMWREPTPKGRNDAA